jgi:hypothetical protein
MVNPMILIKLFCNDGYIENFKVKNTEILRLDNGCLLETNNIILQSSIDLGKKNVANFTFSTDFLNISMNPRENTFPIKFLIKTISFSDHSVSTEHRSQ